MAASAANIDVQRLDPYAFMAVIGKRVLHRGGRGASNTLLARAGIDAGHEILEVGCGVATTAIRVVRKHGARITAVDIDPLMLERAEHSVKSTGPAQQVLGDEEGARRSRSACLRKRAWLWPRIRRAVPYLGFVLISGAKPIEG